MKRFFVLLGLIVIAAIVFIWLVKAPIMSNYLTKKLGVPVKVRSISMWPNETTISHFRISNPPGYKTRTAFEVDKTRINYRWSALNANPIEIDLITLDDVFLNIHINNDSGKDNNWADIGSGMPKGPRDREVVVHKLILRNMTVKTEGPGAKKLGVAGTQHFAQMEFNEIDSKDGFPTKELIEKIFQGAGLRLFIERFINPTNQIRKALNPWNIFGEAEQNSFHKTEDVSNCSP